MSFAWAQTSATQLNWKSICSDSTGQYLAAVVQNGGIYTSTNGGLNWTQRTSGLPTTASWQYICSDSTGQYLAAVVSGGRIYNSTNGGLNWNQQTSGLPTTANWSSICSDSTGQYLAAAVFDGSVYTSTNGGLNWTQSVPYIGAKLFVICSNSTGTKLIVPAYGSGICLVISNDGGLNWSGITAASSGLTTSINWSSICSDSTGQYLAAVVYGGRIYTSTNGGLIWTQRTSGLPTTANWCSICSDSTGQYLAAVNNVALYISINGGLNWNQQTSGLPSTANWNSICSSQNGTTLAAVVINGNIYKGLYIQYPCFKEDSVILTDKGYRPIQDLRKGDLVKTLRNGFLPINMIGKRDIVHFANKNERIKDQLYKCAQDNFNEVFEPLILTGCHSILVDDFISEEQRQKTIEVNGNTYVTDNKYRLPACADERAIVYEMPGTYTIYHFALENDDYFMNYGVYANGLLVETCSKRYLKELSNMELL